MSFKMFTKRRRSLAYAPLYASVLVIFVTVGFIGTYWCIDKYFSYQKSVKNIHSTYSEKYQQRLIEETKNVIDFIEYKRQLTEKSIEEQLEQKVQIAYITASHVYSLYKNSKSPEELQNMVVEILRPIRWDTNLGYFFAGETVTGKMVLIADRPSLEGVNHLEIHENGRYIVREMIDIVKSKGAGLIPYSWSKPEQGENTFKKVAFVKYFAPFQWFIGAGVYVDDLEKSAQKEVLERVKKISFNKHGSFACIKGNGQTLIDFRPQMEGRSVLRVVDDAGQNLGVEIYDIAQSEKRSGFVRSLFEKPDTLELTPRLSYVAYYAEWDWYFVASIFEDEMLQSIEKESDRYRNSIFRDIIMFSIIFSITLILVLVLVYFYSKNIKQGVDLFTDFFQDAADKKVALDDRLLTFKEFATLSVFANRMVEDRIMKEKLIKRDELRLDTLFNLSIMEYHSRNEICRFTLERSLKITDSEMGYIAMSSKEDDKIEVVLFLLDGTGNSFVKFETIPIAEQNNSFAKAYHEGLPVFTDQPSEDSLLKSYLEPENSIDNHLDVPIYDGDEIVAVVGVCNTSEGKYHEADVKQLTIIQEAMWHLILKARNENEVIKLKNLLRSINDSLPSIIIGIDAEYRVIQWNKQAESVTGMSLHDVQNGYLKDVYPRCEEILPLLEKVIHRGSMGETHTVNWKQGGQQVFENIAVTPLKTDRLQGAVIRIDDVTEKVRLEDMMVQSEKMLSIGGLAAGMAHEINNPLAGILQNLQVIQNRLSVKLAKNSRVAEEVGFSIEQIQEYLEKRNINEMFAFIDESANRAASLVSNMLSFSRKSDFAISSRDLGELLDKTLELAANDYDLKKNYDFKKIRIEKQYEDDLPLIPCEGTNIQQVFLNILKNGAQALAEKNFKDDKPQIFVSIYRDTFMVKIEIEDNGPGIPEEKRKRIFEPFYTTKPVGVGTGLGLSISYFIIKEQHGGSLEALSEPGVGTKFIIGLPYEMKSVE